VSARCRGIDRRKVSEFGSYGVSNRKDAVQIKADGVLARHNTELALGIKLREHHVEVFQIHGFVHFSELLQNAVTVNVDRLYI
jgi:hypothetical protein